MTDRETAESVVREQFPMDWKDQRNLTNAIERAITEARREQREVDANLCGALKGDGDKPTDRIIGYEECAAAIREGMELETKEKR